MSHSISTVGGKYSILTTALVKAVYLPSIIFKDDFAFNSLEIKMTLDKYVDQQYY